MTPTSEHHLAQANLARLRHPPGDPRVAEFIAALDHVNRIADQAPGFVWRQPAEDGHVTISDDDPLRGDARQDLLLGSRRLLLGSLHTVCALCGRYGGSLVGIPTTTPA